VGYTLKQFTLLEVTMNEKRFELTVRDSVTGGVLDVDPATYFRALYDTSARNPINARPISILPGQKPGTKPFKSLAKNGGIPW
jgi:hypothetical protein